MPREFDKESLLNLLRQYLFQESQVTAAALRDRLGVSQPVFSRLAGQLRSELFVTGKARSTRYSLLRVIEGVPVHLPVYEVDPQGESRRVAVLHSLCPRGFFVEPTSEDVPGGFFDDLPFFLDGLRPAGFLGRLVPRQFPELELPGDIGRWSAEHCLKYLCRYGWDLVGSLIVGDDAFELFLRNLRNPSSLVDPNNRRREYPRCARDILRSGTPGSSAAGEQPKFLSVRSSDRQPVMVKFVLDVKNPRGRRWADLLISEHLAHQVLSRHSCPAATSELVWGEDGSLYLEIGRFDRTGPRGRRGLLSLQALDAQFVGRSGGWNKVAAALQEAGQIDARAVGQIRWIELFGKLIANSDMHAGNVSFFTHGARCLEVAPVYDMLPMFFAPRDEFSGSTLPDEAWAPPTPSPADSGLWPTALDAAQDFWQAVAAHGEVSMPFQEIARSCIEKLVALRDLASLLPRH